MPTDRPIAFVPMYFFSRRNMSLRSTIRRNFWSDLRIRRICKSLEIEGQIRRIPDLHKMYGQNRKHAQKYAYDPLSARCIGYVTRLNFSAKSATRSEKSAQSTICKIYCPILERSILLQTQISVLY